MARKNRREGKLCLVPPKGSARDQSSHRYWQNVKQIRGPRDNGKKQREPV